MQVYSHGGDVMRFAGDSVICAFLPMPEEAEAEDKGLAAATLRSVRCAAVLAEDLGAFSYLVFESCFPVIEHCQNSAGTAGVGYYISDEVAFS